MVMLVPWLEGDQNLLVGEPKWQLRLEEKSSKIVKENSRKIGGEARVAMDEIDLAMWHDWKA